MDEIKERLQKSADQCFKTYESWNGNKKDNAAREALQEAIHEIRKAVSRVEIEVAISERDQMAQKPIPIPPHRDARGRHQSADDDGVGNRHHGEKPQLKRRSAPKKFDDNGGNQPAED